MKFFVLSSSRGTVFQATLDAMADSRLTAQCMGLITDRPDRGCIGKAEAAHLPVIVVEQREGETPEQYDDRLHGAILDFLRAHANQRNDRTPEAPAPSSTLLIAAMGWMHILTPPFIRRWRNRILNIHPALLPKYGGTGMFGDRVHAAVLKDKERESGITIHLMDEGVDTGPILLQEKCPVLPDDTVASLKSRVQALEREWYPRVLEMIHRGQLKLPEA